MHGAAPGGGKGVAPLELGPAPGPFNLPSDCCTKENKCVNTRVQPEDSGRVGVEQSSSSVLSHFGREMVRWVTGKGFSGRKTLSQVAQKVPKTSQGVLSQLGGNMEGLGEKTVLRILDQGGKSFSESTGGLGPEPCPGTTPRETPTGTVNTFSRSSQRIFARAQAQGRINQLKQHFVLGFQDKSTLR